MAHYSTLYTGHKATFMITTSRTALASVAVRSDAFCASGDSILSAVTAAAADDDDGPPEGLPGEPSLDSGDVCTYTFHGSTGCSKIFK